MKIRFFGSSLVSAYWNGAATYYRGLLHALAERGHDICFYEPDAFDRQAHRDIEDPPWARVCVYPAEPDGVMRALEQARDADLVVKASGVGVFDELLEAAVLELQGPRTRVVYWDVDAPATLDRLIQTPNDPFAALVSRYDLVFTYGGGPPVVRAYHALGAQRCVPIYNAVDPATHHPEPPEARYAGLLGFLGNRLPDREARVDEFFLGAARRLPGERFVLGGNGWGDLRLPDNVAYLGHVYTREHNAFNCSPRAVLNINRQSMASYGYSPATRVFEAAGAGACIISDSWDGIELFLEPGTEVLMAQDGGAVAEHLARLDDTHAREIGARARARVLAAHTYAHRAVDVERALGELGRPRLPKSSKSARSPSGRASSESTAASVVHAVDAADDTTERIQAREPSERALDDSLCPRLRIVILGLSITSSWGNGHATTYRGLMRELCARGHDVVFLERDMPWYAEHRDLPEPPYGRTELYQSLLDLQARFAGAVRAADLVIVGSYVPEGVAVGHWVTRMAQGLTGFYDIDTPVTLGGLASGTCDYLSAELIPRYDLYLSFTGGPTLARIETEYGAPRAYPLYCSADPTCHGTTHVGAWSWELGYMGTYSRDRQDALDELLIAPARQRSASRFVVAGPSYPDSLSWPANVERIEHLAPGAHSAFYGAQRFTLNITRAPMRQHGYSPSIRLFEAALCATPVITDAWAGLETFFAPGREILVARTAGDVLGYLDAISEEERMAVGQRARARVLAEHTAAHRARTLEHYYVEASARPAVQVSARSRPS